MSTIIIGDGLTNDVLSPAHQFEASKENVGQREIARLLGKGKSFGDGPLPSFLRHALEARTRGESVHLVLLQRAEAERTPGHRRASRTGDPFSFVQPIVEVAAESIVLAAASDMFPWSQLLETIGRISGIEAVSEDVRNENVRFLVVGCHTEKHILAIASFLRRVLGFSEVAVSSHLIGSATQEAHLATLRHNLPEIGVRVFLDLEETATYAGLDPSAFTHFDAHPCTIEPRELRERIAEHRRIIELLCMHWTRARLRPLAGGFSGSLLFLAEGWKGEARTEPMVLKIDSFRQMRRELDGYYQVRDFFGKHMPTYGYPVAEGDALGVGMELAAMEGGTETLQDTFENVEGDEALGRFMVRLEKAMSLLSDKLYQNTRERAWVTPYRAFGLHAAQQQTWLRDNADVILQYLAEANGSTATVDAEQLVSLVRAITANEDGMETEICLVHGDLNLANVICDSGDNPWIIDWTHCGPAPVESDFAKLENDVKFVMTKEFDVDDLPRLRTFEEYLVAQQTPADVDGLPEVLKFARWDLRFRKILGAVRKIRQACFTLKQSDDWLVYRIALLKYALHTLSFDKRRGRGECDVPQLMYALYSVEHLAHDLAVDEFHLKIGAERPPEYPPRLRISVDRAPWVRDVSDYNPPYFVHASVLANDHTKARGGWADPEDVSTMQADLAARPAGARDALGRPLNPKGRTGIAGRGLLGLWGANLSLAATLIRRNTATGDLEILLGLHEGETELALPKGFILPQESPDACLQRVVTGETGWHPGMNQAEIVFQGYTYDPRQTDHAWVESRAYLLFDDDDAFFDNLTPWSRTWQAVSSAEVEPEHDEVKWWPLDAATVNRVPPGSAHFIRESVRVLMDSGRMGAVQAERLLSGTG